MHRVARVILISVALSAALAGGVVMANRTPIPPTAETEASRCIAKLSDYKKIGPALTISDVEARSLAGMKARPDVPQVPFGYSNDEWLSLKSKVKPGDSLHDFETDVTGGILLVRGDCVIDQLTSWIR
jgi:hypothetical protein